MDYYQILRVPRNVDRDRLHRSFREISKKTHPDRFDDADRSRAEKEYQTIVIAFNNLKDPSLRMQYDQELQNQASARDEQKDSGGLAEKYYKSGLNRYQKGDYEAAVECFRRAVHYHEDAEYYYHKGMAEGHLPRLRKDSVASLQKAIDKNPGNPKYYQYLAKLFLSFGLKARAKSLLDKAVALFPKDEALLAQAKDLQPEKSKKSGFFGNLFGKK